ncbi:MAG: hypothetical protein IJI38_03825, partial [Clostridia bacterium]|nr:hypothetical protein [Clostridia bacterium]
ACAALCWTDSAQHGRQSFSENGRMSGRVDAIRVKKQSFDVFWVMHSAAPALRILGHWNYPPDLPENYRFHEKRFNGVFWEETEETGRRDPRHKTVYCIGSYAVEKVLLLVNGRQTGICDRPESGFVFAFPDVDVTQSGVIEAVGYGYDGQEVCRDRIETTGPSARIRLTPHTAPGGWRADGNDLCFVDLEVTDDKGRVCPLADMRIDFEVHGNAVWLGGYNSGRFNGNGRCDNVIGQPFVFAECGTGRVLLRSGTAPDSIRLTASAQGLTPAEVRMETIASSTERLTPDAPSAMLQGQYPPKSEDAFPAIERADAVKYTPEAENYCKVMVNGQEPDSRGVRAVNRNGSVWGNVLCILERMRQIAPDRLQIDWNADTGILTVHTGEHVLTVQVGKTHLVMDGQESLMDGQPYVTPEGILVMEINAIAPLIQGASAQYDDRIGALRVTL